MRKSLTALIGLIGLILLFAGFSGNRLKYPGGSPAGYTGSPGDGDNCVHCHGGSPTNVSGWITSDIPPDGYTPGLNYTITVTVSGSGNKGFEVSPQNIGGTLLGTLTAGAGNKLVGSGKYVTQSSSSNTNPKIWNFTWTAPASGTGAVIFYGAFAISTSTTKLSTLTVPEYINTGISERDGFPLTMYPNPATDQLNFSYSLTGIQTIKIDILSPSGMVVKNWTYENQGPGDQTSSMFFMEKKLPAGLYLVRFSAGINVLTKKLIVL